MKETKDLYSTNSDDLAYSAVYDLGYQHGYQKALEDVEQLFKDYDEKMKELLK